MLDRELREMAYTPRWSIVRTNRQQYLADHTFFVAMYANDIAVHLGLSQAQIGTLLQRVLWHDVDEIFTGDIPGPAKRVLVKDREWLEDRVGEWMRKVFRNLVNRDGSMQGPANDDAMITAIIKLADYLDECCELGSEIQMGNRNLDAIFADSMARVCNAADSLMTAMDWQGGTDLRDIAVEACMRSREVLSRHTSVFGAL